MLKKFMAALGVDQAAKVPEMSAQVALSALMVQLARADHDFAQSEADRIVSVLQKRFALDGSAAKALLAEGIAAEEASHDTVRFTRVVKDDVALEDRFDLLKDFWSLVLADDHRDHEEDGQMRLITNLLGVSDRDSALARQAALKDAKPA